jgi:hypothetical protein
MKKDVLKEGPVSPVEVFNGKEPAGFVDKEPVAKSLGNTDASGTKKTVKDVVFFGNGDTFQLLCKASSKAEGWMKSTKAMEIPGVGCIVQVTTQQGESIAEALTFVLHVKVANDEENGGRKLVSL